ncbi:MAG: AMP-binding protein [Muribaculaceae bacterium]|nr:AMP-binding protein [Muribaculaceae bacterium]
MKTIDNQGIPGSLNGIIERAIKNFWNLDALSDFDGVSYRYADVAENIEKIHILFEAAGLEKGDKVALCGKNSSDWMVILLSCLTFGAVAVPILHEFNSESVTNLVNHSESKLLFADKSILDKLEEKDLPALEGAIYISERGLAFSRNPNLIKTRERLNEIFGERYPDNFTAENVAYKKDEPEQLALINYTSGSTGSPKGVMLPYRSLLSNIVYCIEHLTFMKPGDGMINMLPLGHMYGLVIESLHPFVKGCHCHFLSKAPSPKVLLGAFSKVRPKLIITVPLVLEKIIKGNIFPKLKTPLMKAALAIPVLNGYIYGKIKGKLIDVFGGQIKEIIIGGAPLNPDVEKFLYRIKFPVTVGYGMTECGPLLTYAPSSLSKPQTVGCIVDRMEVKIDSPNPETVPGNIMVKGRNVMLGYFKNPEATGEVFPNDDGWMNTGDMGTIDKDGYISISGRSKTMILGPSGQNIYPEEIEHKINNLPYVEESLVIEDDGKLVALIFPNYEMAQKAGLDREALDRLMDNNLTSLNKGLEAYSRLNSHRLVDEEFQKTPKRSIKRFLYQKPV